MKLAGGKTKLAFSCQHGALLDFDLPAHQKRHLLQEQKYLF
jgi:hypothetical protein